MSIYRMRHSGFATESTPAVLAPVNTGVPVITGTPTQGETLSASQGTWSNDPVSYTYQWKRGATNIGTGNSNYVLVAGDVGSTITVEVTATNEGGSASATSAATAAIAAPAPAILEVIGRTAPVVNGAAASPVTWFIDNPADQAGTITTVRAYMQAAGPLKIRRVTFDRANSRAYTKGNLITLTAVVGANEWTINEPIDAGDFIAWYDNGVMPYTTTDEQVIYGGGDQTINTDYGTAGAAVKMQIGFDIY